MIGSKYPSKISKIWVLFGLPNFKLSPKWMLNWKPKMKAVCKNWQTAMMLEIATTMRTAQWWFRSRGLRSTASKLLAMNSLEHSYGRFSTTVGLDYYRNGYAETKKYYRKVCAFFAQGSFERAQYIRNGSVLKLYPITFNDHHSITRKRFFCKA